MAYRITTHKGRTTKGGKAYSARHLDRKFPLKNAPHIDPTRKSKDSNTQKGGIPMLIDANYYFSILQSFGDMIDKTIFYGTDMGAVRKAARI